MDIQLAPDLQAKLFRMAEVQGRDSADLVSEAVERMVSEDDSFRTAVREGIAAADRGEFVDHEQVWAKVEEVLSGK